MRCERLLGDYIVQPPFSKKWQSYNLNEIRDNYHKDRCGNTLSWQNGENSKSRLTSLGTRQLCGFLRLSPRIFSFSGPLASHCFSPSGCSLMVSTSLSTCSLAHGCLSWDMFLCILSLICSLLTSSLCIFQKQELNRHSSSLLGDVYLLWQDVLRLLASYWMAALTNGPGIIWYQRKLPRAVHSEGLQLGRLSSESQLRLWQTLWCVCYYSLQEESRLNT